MSRRAPVPLLQSGLPQVDQFAESVKQHIDRQTGQQRNTLPLKPLPSTATLADLIVAYNALLARVQGTD